MRIPLILLFVYGIFGAITLGGCDSETGPGASGTLTLADGDGVDFDSGQLMDPGNYGNSDIFTSRNGDALKLSTGGESPISNNPVTWFKTSGGIISTYGSLAEVPLDKPDETMTTALVKAKVGVGFVVQRHSGRYTRGWIVSADADTVTLEFEPLP